MSFNSIYSLISALALSLSIQMPFTSLNIVTPNKSEQVKSTDLEIDNDDGIVDSYGKVTCKVGFKPAKTAISLVAGAKAGCYKVVLAAAGKKRLTKLPNTCFACHGSTGVAPYTGMISKFRLMGLTISPADIATGFNAHVAEMSGATMSATQAKQISTFLRSLRG